MRLKETVQIGASTGRLDSLDALRGIAALAVVVYHLGYRVAEVYPEVGDPIDVLVAGQYGVQLFFVISGIVIFLSLHHVTPRTFLISRFIRLYPIYWVCAAVTFSAVAVIGLPGREVTAVEGAVNLTMLQAYLGVPHIDGAYWTLAAEIGFYVQVALLFFSTRLLRGRWLAVTLYAWIGLATVASQVPKLLSGAIRDVTSQLALGFVWIPLFVAGMAIYCLWSGRRSAPLMGVPLAATAVMALRDPALGVAVLVCVLLVLLALWGPPLGRLGKPLFFLGEISYALYLIHQNVGFILIRWLTGLGLSHLVAACLATFVVVAMASLLTYLLDRPIRRALRRMLLPQRETSRPSASNPNSAKPA